MILCNVTKEHNICNFEVFSCYSFCKAPVKSIPSWMALLGCYSLHYWQISEIGFCSSTIPIMLRQLKLEKTVVFFILLPRLWHSSISSRVFYYHNSSTTRHNFRKKMTWEKKPMKLQLSSFTNEKCCFVCLTPNDRMSNVTCDSKITSDGRVNLRITIPGEVGECGEFEVYLTVTIL